MFLALITYLSYHVEKNIRKHQITLLTFDLYCQTAICPMQTLGDILRQQREKRNLLLRQVGASMEIDQALISKFERGERKPTREQVLQFAKLFEMNEDDLLVAWLSDKLAYEVQDESLGLKAMQMAEKKIKQIKKLNK